MSLLDSCLKQNYFSLNNIIYISDKGLIILMNFLEKVLHNDPLTKELNYVDDILLCLNGTVGHLRRLEFFIQSIHPYFKFTTEMEQSNSISFLYLKIFFKNRHNLFIFHEPSHTDITILIISVHPF